MKFVYENRNGTLQKISNSNAESITDSSAQNNSLHCEVMHEKLGKNIQASPFSAKPSPRKGNSPNN